MRMTFRAVLVLAGALLLARTAAAEPERDDDYAPALAMGTGGVTSLASFTLGTISLARSHTRTAKNAGLLAGQGGLTLAPLFSHMVVGETARGALFSLIPLAGVVTNSIVAAAVPDFVAHAAAPVQYTAFAAVAVSTFGAALGILDAARVSERAKAAGLLERLTISPVVARTETAVMIGGIL